MELTNIYHINEIGGKRNQEDYIWPPPGNASFQDKVFIVCDGVGGSENGELASMIVAESLAENLQKIPLKKLTLEDIDNIVYEAKHKLAEYVRTNNLNSDMATTLALLLLFDNKALCVWCGDSRIYHIRNGHTLYKTLDHSLVNTLIRNGEISAEEARTHTKKNIILKAVKADGSDVEYEHYWITDIKNGDYFLLCTDGLLENIDDKELKELLNDSNANEADLVPAFQRFCENKTRDNYSMYLLRVSAVITRTPANKGKKYFINAIILLFVILTIIFLYFRNAPNSAVSSSPLKKNDSAVVNGTSAALPSDSSKNVSVDSGIDYEIVKSDEKLDSMFPQASATIIQPIKSTPKTPEQRLPGQDSVTTKKKKSNALSDPGKSDSTKSNKPSN